MNRSTAGYLAVLCTVGWASAVKVCAAVFGLGAPLLLLLPLAAVIAPCLYLMFRQMK